jgi:glycosyltransferase involved in cell wall biosynthesis
MSTAPLISAVVTCKGRLEHLKFTLPHLLALPDCEVIVVDYDCPEHAGDWVRATHPQARVVQVADRPIFNAAQARNLGVAAANAPWLLMVDADVIVAPELIDVLRGRLRPGVYLLPELRPYPLMGTVVLAREDYDAIGGYDEAFQGYGSEDLDLTSRLEMSGREAATFPGCLRSIIHDDGLRAQFYEIPDLVLNRSINELYRIAKMDLLKLGVSIGPEQARALYDGARAAVLSPEKSPKLDVRLPPRTAALRPLEVTISFRLSVAPPPDTT